MQIKHLKHNEIDFQKWDACILNAHNSLVYAESWYLDVVSPAWEALILGDYEYVMPLPVKRKFGIPFLVQPPLTQQLGVFSKNKIDQKIVESFVRKIPYWSYHLNLNYENNYNKAIEQPNFVLNLNTDYETLYSNYSKNTKRNIKKALQAGITVKKISTEQFLKFYFSTPVPESYLMPNEELSVRLMQTATKRKKLIVYGGFSIESKLISVLSLLRTKNRLIYLLAMSEIEGKNLSVMSTIVDIIFRDYSSTDYYIDFEGSKVEGIARFYQGFGSENQTYFHIENNSIVSVINRIKHFGL